MKSQEPTKVIINAPPTSAEALAEAFAGAGLRVEIQPDGGRATLRPAGIDAELSLGPLQTELDRVHGELEPRGIGDFAFPWLSDFLEVTLARLNEDLHRRAAELRVLAPWPYESTHAVVMTHDVDVPRPLPDFAERRSLANVVEHLSRSVKPFRRRHLMRIGELEIALGFGTTWFCLPQYPEVSVKQLLDALPPSSEVGLHALGNGYSDEAELRRQKRLFELSAGHQVSALRTHLLSFDLQKTWDVASRAGFTVDSSFAWNDMPGFRGGQCLPWRPRSFGFLAGPIWELPMAFMDWTYLSKGLRGEEVVASFAAGIRRVRERHGVACVNVHNSYLDRWNNPRLVRAFEGLLVECSSRAVWRPTVSQCMAYWSRRIDFLLGRRMDPPDGCRVLCWKPRGEGET